MILESGFLSVKTGQSAAFEAAFSTASPIIASMPLRLLLKTLQCFFTKQVRVPLACFGELDDLVGDDLVSNRIVINFYPSISKRGANQLIRYSHNAHGLRIE